MLVSFGLFWAEILVNSVVDATFKYSFFFYLDIIATLSIIPDIPWILDLILALFGIEPHHVRVDAVAGIYHTESIASGKVT